jgi:hypothetical protein
LHAGQQLVQRGWEIVPVRARDISQLRFDARELVGQYRLEQFDLAREMSVKRFLADAQLLRQIIHGYTAESVTEEVRPRRFNDSLPTGIGRSVSFFSCQTTTGFFPFH